MNRPNSRVRTAVTIIVALLLVAALILPAFAHAQLLSSDPVQGASLPTVEQVVLTFNEDINPDFVQVTVAGPDGVVDLDAALVDGPVVTQPLAPSASGAYSLTYRVVSADGHPVSGAVAFTLTDVPAATTGPNTAETTPAAPAPSTETEPVTETTAESAAEEGAAAEGAAAEEGADTAGGPLLWLGGTAMLAGLAGAGVWLTRQRRHPEH